jgi:hypothetical protein
MQGFSGGFVCQSQSCKCVSSTQCRSAGGGTVTCDSGTGQCACDGTVCRPGEGCLKSGAVQVCSCNGGSACGAGLVCCQTPSGCKNLDTDNSNCGACGHGCAPGQSCSAGVCG